MKIRKIKCLHEHPCLTNMCPKILHPEQYKYGICQVNRCDTVKEYCKLNSRDYNFCPKCGEKLYQKTETLRME